MKFKPVDYVVLVLVFILVVFFVMLSIGMIKSNDKLDAQARSIIENLIMSMIAIISIYVGAKLRSKK